MPINPPSELENAESLKKSCNYCSLIAHDGIHIR